MNIRTRTVPGIGLLILAIFAQPAMAQLGLPVIQGFASPKAVGVTHSLVADVAEIVPGKPFHIGINFDVQDGSHLYYRTAGSLGLPTKVQFEVPEGFILGPVQFPAPEIKHEELDQPVIYYVYSRPTVVFAEVTPPSTWDGTTPIEFRAKLSYQYCDATNCRPVSDPRLTLALPVSKGSAEPAPSDHEKAFRRAARQVPKIDEDPIVKVESFLSASAVRPNDKVTLALELRIKDGFHIQMHQPPDPTLISTEVVLEAPDGIDFSPPQFPEPLAPTQKLAGFENVKEYRNRLTVLVPIRARKFVQPGELILSGFVRYQACDERGCRPPAFAEFSLSVPVEEEGTAVHEIRPEVFAAMAMAVEPVKPTSSPPTTPAETPAGVTESAEGSVLDQIKGVRSEAGSESLLAYLVYAFLGGLILNVMPCVLPVIAIKVLGFVNQAGESRFQVFLLNMTYSVGVVSVFLALASLAAFAGLGWGQLFQSAEFNLIMACMVFTMGLSLLGVFEIPVPGFAGSIDTGNKEGPIGAFLTGVLATLLATPCSGPFMGATLAWSVRQPAEVIFLVWGVMGLGMASPYILCGIFPAAVRWLPKPGMWMVRFKEFAGFVLLGTVVYIVSFLNSVYVLPLLVILLGITAAIWLNSNMIDARSSSATRWATRIAAVALFAASTSSALWYFKPIAELRARADFERMLAETGGKVELPDDPGRTDIAWIPFTESNLERFIKEEKTIFIDFTADWCLICKANEFGAIERPKIRELMEEFGVVPLKADWTDKSDEIKKWLTRFDGASVPHYVVVSAQDPTHPIIFDGTLTESIVESKIRQAGPSKGNDAPAQASVSMTPLAPAR